MADATVKTGYQPPLADCPNIEVVYLEADDGETYTSRKFRKVRGAIIQFNDSAAADEYISAELSSTADGQVIIHITGSQSTGAEICIKLYGEP